MSARSIGRVALALLAGCAASACQPDAAPDPVVNAADPAANASVIEAPEPEAEATPAPKSIIREGVSAETDEDAVPPLEPASLTVPFGDRTTTSLDDAARAAIDGLLANPVVAAGGPILLRGHSDTRGSDADNLAASRRRAETVRAYLVEKGVDAKRVTIVALGENRPIAPNMKLDGSDDPEGRAKNRRVEVEVQPPAPAPAPPAPEAD
ncbi:OOP family OmpA-OmpF porin [Sphingomonas zeicaulis]|uniref:OmpA family protein n=1 Tax=Sphingomonas zeicaulis TaxID=1632740 RepID=UPI003D1B582C